MGSASRHVKIDGRAPDSWALARRLAEMPAVSAIEAETVRMTGRMEEGWFFINDRFDCFVSRHSIVTGFSNPIA